MPTRLAQSECTGEHFPYDAFDRLPTTPIAVGGGTLNVGFAPGEFALPRSALMAWLEKSAKAVSVYFGKFPVASAKVLIVPASGSGVQRGTTFGYRGAAIRLAVGSDSTEADLADDWKAVHEQDWQDWPVERIFRVADKATGVTVLSELYEKMRAKPYSPDLDALWRDLGISVRDGQVTFDDSAPLAPVRRAITTVPSL